MTVLSLSLGALEIGILFSTALYGVASIQAFIYAERNLKDALWLRVMVVLVWLFESVHTGLTWALLYSLTVTNYGQPSAIENTPWSLAMTIPLTSFVGSTVQVFFAYRVRVLSGRMILPIIAWTGAILRLGFGVTLGVVVVKSQTIPRFFQHFRWLVDAQLSLDAAVDILNTGSLCYYLLCRRTDFKPTQRLVDKLVVYTIETGLLTSLCAVTVLICSLIMPDNLIYLSVFMIYPKLFSNSLFTSLNTRQALRRLPLLDTADFRWTDVSSQRTPLESNAIALMPSKQSKTSWKLDPESSPQVAVS
ncbi:hypothetical protein K439DRAFT_1637393 [Ramaria rubella]|nr:hypothetical protein K439DRAFT_1637393 [Ramaria rubella]